MGKIDNSRHVWICPILSRRLCATREEHHAALVGEADRPLHVLKPDFQLPETGALSRDDADDSIQIQRYCVPRIILQYQDALISQRDQALADLTLLRPRSERQHLLCRGEHRRERSQALRLPTQAESALGRDALVFAPAVSGRHSAAHFVPLRDEQMLAEGRRQGNAESRLSGWCCCPQSARSRSFRRGRQ